MKLVPFIKQNWMLLSVIIASLVITWPSLMPGYFFHHDDLQVMRVFEMRKCFEDFQIPCRWVPDMGYGNGYPLFNFYSVLPYYIGGFLTFFFGFVGAAKGLFFLAVLTGGISMYFLGSELFGKSGGMTAGILYAYAPYRALDAFVRGAIAESFALAIIPLVFYFNLRLLRYGRFRDFIGLAISFGGFLMCHNIMTMFFMPFFVIWNVFWLYRLGRKHLPKMVISHGLGIGLAAFFLFPIFLEKDLVHTETLLQFGSDFRAHFVTFPQLFFDRKWDFGASVFGPGDTISFQVGWPHWWLVIAGAITSVWSLLKFKKKEVHKWENFSLFVILAGIFSVSVFLTHNKSAFIWEAIGPLQYAQFPWRFLAIAIFTTSLIGGLIVFTLPKKIRTLMCVLIAVVTIALNWNYFTPKDFYPWIDDKTKLADPLWEIQQKAGVLDYLPQTAWLEPQSRAPDYPEVRKGEIKSDSFKVYTDHFDSRITVISDATVEFPVLDFPDWQLWINGQKADHFYDKHWGRISIDLKPGSYTIYGKLQNTPVRTISNWITLLSFISIGLLIYFRKHSFLKKFDFKF